jgi:hypothetical protein
MASNDVIKSNTTYTYGDLSELYRSWFPTISSDTELPKNMYVLIVPKTIGEWFSISNAAYERVTPAQAFELFKTDILAREPCTIYLEEYSTCGGNGFQSFGITFNPRGGNNKIFVPGYSDEQRQLLTYESPYSEDLKYAIIASGARVNRIL